MGASDVGERLATERAVQHAEGRRGGETRSHGHVLSHRDDEGTDAHGIGAPGLAVKLLQAEARSFREGKGRLPLALPETVRHGVVDLHDDLVGLRVPDDGEVRRVLHRQGIAHGFAEGLRGFLQMGVEERVEFGLC